MINKQARATTYHSAELDSEKVTAVFLSVGLAAISYNEGSR